MGNNASGVVHVDQDEPQAMLKLPAPISSHGLAVMILATQANAHMHSVEPTRFPAMCTSTGEPLIAAGYIHQLGAQQVQRNGPATKLAVEEQDAVAIRCPTFRCKIILSKLPLAKKPSSSRRTNLNQWWLTFGTGNGYQKDLKRPNKLLYVGKPSRSLDCNK